MRRSTRLMLVVILVVYWFSPHELAGQEARYELGRRLKRFEVAWQQADDQRRALTVAAMEQAVSSFFSLRWLDAASQLDAATRVFSGPLGDDKNYRWAMAQRISASPIFADTQSTKLELTLAAFYPSESLPNEPVQLEFKLAPIVDLDELFPWYQANSAPTAKASWSHVAHANNETSKWTVDVPMLEEGDYWLTTEAVLGTQTVEIGRCILSRTDDLSRRLDSLNSMGNSSSQVGTATGRATLRNSVKILSDLNEGIVQEIDYPAHRILQDTEKLVELEADSRQYFKKSFEGNAWLALGHEKRTAVCRLYVPTLESDSPCPVLFLFHGAGGSENMFFETYGAGRAIELAKERGWLIIAPRQSLLGGLGMKAEQMLDILDDHFRIDRERIYYVGHSMGATQAVSQAALAPALPRAVVALGGGGRLGSTTNPTTRWFVGAGDRDFGLRGARALEASLKAKGTDVELRVYPNVEHMVIVQAALDDVFSFLDNAR